MNDIPADSPDPLSTTTGIQASQKELKFIKKFKELNGNRTLAAKLCFECKDDRSASAIGSKLAKKFGLSKPNTVVMPDNKYDADGFDTEKMAEAGLHSNSEEFHEESLVPGGGQHGKIELLTDALKSGALSFKDLFDEMKKIAFFYKDKSVSIRALVKMKDWWDEAKRQRDSLEMSERDITDVLSTALASIGREKYVEVLKLCRQKRLELIRKRNKKIDVDAIVKDEQEKKLWGGNYNV